MKSTAKTIKKLLIDAGVSQAEIARQAGVDRTAVAHVTAGRSRSSRLRRLIAEAAGVSVESLWPNYEPRQRRRERKTL